MTTDTHSTPTAAAPFPPFSGADAQCAMCSHGEAYTHYRPTQHRFMREFNGRVERHHMLPARLERQCGQCDYQWDEALNPTPGIQQATLDEVAMALENSYAGWALDLSPELAVHMASNLLESLHVLVRPDHPLWKAGQSPAPGPALLAADALPDELEVFAPAQQPAQPKPQPTAETTGGTDLGEWTGPAAFVDQTPAHRVEPMTLHQAQSALAPKPFLTEDL